jgi:hypothetical protein
VRRSPIVLAVALAFATGGSSAREDLACDQGYCVIAEPVLKELARRASLTEAYGAMCNWPGYTAR